VPGSIAQTCAAESRARDVRYDPDMRRAILLMVAGCAANATVHQPMTKTPPPPPPPPAITDDAGVFGAIEDDQGAWVEQWREALNVGGADLWLVGRHRLDEGDALTITRRDGRILGSVPFVFGGLGGTLTVTARCTTPGWVLLKLREEGTTKGYALLPGQGRCPAITSTPPAGATDEAEQTEGEQTDGEQTEDDPCRVPSDTDVSFLEIAFDATHVWLVTAATETEPVRACYAQHP
jgi:hypothetical protein